MQIRTKMLIVISGLFLVSVVLISVFSGYISMSHARSMEDKESAEQIRDAEGIINDDLEELKKITGDWSHWDNSYQFMIDQNDEFLSANLNNETVENLQTNAIIFLNKNKNIIASKFYDTSKNEEAPFPEEITSKILTTDIYNFINSRETKSGYITFMEMPVMYSVSQITMSDLSGTPNGYLIMARVLDKKMTEKYSKRMGAPVSILTDKEINSDDSLSDIKKEVAREGFFVVRSKDALVAYSLFKDLDNNSVFMLEGSQSRDIYNKAKTNLLHLNIVLVIILLTVSVVLFFYINKLVISRLEILNDNIDSLKDSTDSNTRFKVDSKNADEISEISKSLNELIDRVDRWKS